MARVITLLTDFGYQDGYVAAMKGVMLGICPEARLIDLCHGIAPQDIRSGAFVLATTYAHFPAGSIHVAVVDPGVGTERHPLAVRCGEHLFVGPDNGLFSLVWDRHLDWEARILDEPRFWRPRVSATFHGRDIFAPAAAHLAAGVPFEAMGSPCRPVLAAWGKVTCRKDTLHGQIVHVDRFGNAVSNIDAGHLHALGEVSTLRAFVADAPFGIYRTYSEVPEKTPLALIGSSGFLEFALNAGNLAESLSITTGCPVRVEKDR